MPRSYAPEWLEMLEGTFVCDFTRGARVGGYIQANVTGLFPQIRAFLDSNVPIWIEWYLPAIFATNHKHALPFFPNESGTQRAMDRARTNTHDPIYGPKSIDDWANTTNKPSFYQGGVNPFDEAFDDQPGEAGMMRGNFEDSDEESDYGEGLDEDEDADSILEHPSRAASQLRSSPPVTRPSLPAPRPNPPSPRRILPAPRPSLPSTWTQSATNIPVVYAGSGQPAGETHIDFFQRREAERAAAVKRDSDVEYELRRDLEDKARRGHKVHLRALFLWKVERRFMGPNCC